MQGSKASVGLECSRKARQMDCQEIVMEMEKSRESSQRGNWEPDYVCFVAL